MLENVNFSIDHHTIFQCQKLLKNRKCPNPLMFLQGVKTRILAEGSNEVNEVKNKFGVTQCDVQYQSYKG